MLRRTLLAGVLVTALAAVALLLHPLGAAASLIEPALPAPQPLAQPLEYLGNYDPGTPDLNASAVGLDGIAYLGSWGSASNCPGLGVRVVDVRDPYLPTPIAVAAAYRRTTAEHLAAFPLASETFQGNLLLVGIQRCASVGDEGGLAVWDVTDPYNPRELSYLSVGSGPRGVHEFTVGESNGRWYAYLAVPNSEVFDGRGDLRVVDVTDPYNPVEVASWGARRDAGLPVGFGAQCAPYCRGTMAQAFLHSVALSPDGRTAYLSYWDLGMLVLDVSNPAAPYLLGHFRYSQRAEGNTHSIAIAHQGRVALVADETFAPPWGRLRLVDVQDPANAVQVGAFDTPNSAAERPGSANRWYTIHNPLVDDRDPYRAYLAWYSDGVRVVDVWDASAPVEVASWVPPFRPFVWSVAFMGDLLLVGDVNGGLYVLRR